MQQTVEIQTTPKGTFITIPNHDSYIDHPDFNTLTLNVDFIDGVGEVFESDADENSCDLYKYQFSLFFNGGHVNVVFGQDKEKEAYLYWKSIHEICVEGKVGGEYSASEIDYFVELETDNEDNYWANFDETLGFEETQDSFSDEFLKFNFSESLKLLYINDSSKRKRIFVCERRNKKRHDEIVRDILQANRCFIDVPYHIKIDTENFKYFFENNFFEKVNDLGNVCKLINKNPDFLMLIDQIIGDLIVLEKEYKHATFCIPIFKFIYIFINGIHGVEKFFKQRPKIDKTQQKVMVNFLWEICLSK